MLGIRQRALVTCNVSASVGEKLKPTVGLLRRYFLLALIFVQPIFLQAQQQRDDNNPQGKWEVLKNCRLAANAAADGDSFHVVHQGRQYIFRLYFVDAPETDAELSERIQDQAIYFGISAAHVPRAGGQAARFTREKLSSREFTVVTRWENALGRSKLVRFYALIFANSQNLAAELVANGWARIYGARASWPGGPQTAEFIEDLKKSEKTAREQRRGIWNEQAYSRNGHGPVGAPVVGNNPNKAVPDRLNINNASPEDLQTLPGIGPKLAQRIVTHRPYRKIQDLERVPGFGKKTIERLRPRLRFDR
jgi:competence ComEA-like helix-hairpin-helix protein